MKLSKTHAAIVALITANIIWGSSAAIFKWSLDAMPPFTFIFIRFLLATLLLLPFTFHNLSIKRHDIPKIFILTFVGFTLHISTIFLGLTMSPSINASIIASSAPVFLLAASFFVLKEKLKRKVIVGTLFSLLGIVIIIMQPFIESGIEGSLIGNLFFVIATISFVIYAVLMKEFKLPYSPLTLTFWIFLMATITFLPLFALESGLKPLTIPPQGLLGILFGAIFTSNIAYMLFNYAINHIQANEVGIFLYIDPVVTVLIAVPLLGETVTSTFLLGALFVFGGIMIAEGRLQYHPVQLLRKKNTVQ